MFCNSFIIYFNKLISIMNIITTFTKNTSLLIGKIDDIRRSGNIATKYIDLKKIFLALNAIYNRPGININKN